MCLLVSSCFYYSACNPIY